MTPVAEADLGIGARIKWIRGDHAGSLCDVIDMTATTVRLRPLAGHGSPHQRDFTRSRGEVLACTDLVRVAGRERLSTSEIQLPTGMSWFENKGEHVTTTDASIEHEVKHAIRFLPLRDRTEQQNTRLALIMDTLEHAGIEREHFERAVQAWGLTDTARRLGLTAVMSENGAAGILSDVLVGWGIPTVGRGFKRSGAISADIEARFTTTLLSNLPRFGPGQPSRKNGPVKVRFATPTDFARATRVDATTGSLAALMQQAHAEKLRLRERERKIQESTQRELAEIRTEIDQLDKVIALLRKNG